MDSRTRSRVLLTRPVLTAVALVAPLAALSTGAALAGHNPVTAPLDAVTALATLDETQTANDPAAAETPTATPTETSTSTPTESATADGTASPDATGTPSPSGTALSAAEAAHTNGLGCDDILWANGRGPGGPIGCEVGNSGSHRQNGANKATATSTPEATETATPTETPTEEAAPEDEGFDPHANGKGCDDVLATNGRGPGGPVGCEVGNSGEHRQNGAKNATVEPTSTATTEPTSEPTAMESGSKVTGKGKANGSAGGNGNGKGNGKNK